MADLREQEGAQSRANEKKTCQAFCTRSMKAAQPNVKPSLKKSENRHCSATKTIIFLAVIGCTVGACGAALVACNKHARHFAAQSRHNLLVFNAFVRPPRFRCWRAMVGRCSAAPSARVSLSVSGRAASLFLPHPPVRFRLLLKNPRRSQPANAEMGC